MATEKIDVQLTEEQVELCIEGLHAWQSEFQTCDGDWSDVEALCELLEKVLDRS